jgi:hypothetical protein
MTKILIGAAGASVVLIAGGFVVLWRGLHYRI